MKYFKIEEFDCKHTGKNEMVPEFLEKLDHLRDECGFPFVVTSGYRDKTHPVEAAKKAAGVHSQGIACDIKVNTGYQRYVLLKKAFEHGFTGIGVAKDFIHLDARMGIPVVWTYS